MTIPAMVGTVARETPEAMARIAVAAQRHHIEYLNHPADRAEQPEQRAQGDQHADHRLVALQLLLGARQPGAAHMPRCRTTLLQTLLPGPLVIPRQLRKHPRQIPQTLDHQRP